MLEHGIYFGERSVRKIGTSLNVSLPYEWVHTVGLKKGDRVEVWVNDKQMLIVPVKKEKRKVER